ncbi:DUF397 domain-containing protein [Streptomyces netropsis]|uniref:DUF397 domain-containing protein n=1 Tax=Streptomyces netropsis TaxID=55404 RepID=UPI001616CD4B|nr:DUF397 domain-containing protein [Streptomyces netropsis]
MGPRQAPAVPGPAAQVPGVRSQGNSDGQEDCLEIAENIPTGIVAVRDSKRPHHPALTFRPTAWHTFVTAVRNGSGYASGIRFR